MQELARFSLETLGSHTGRWNILAVRNELACH